MNGYPQIEAGYEITDNAIKACCKHMFTLLSLKQLHIIQPGPMLVVKRPFSKDISYEAQKWVQVLNAVTPEVELFTVSMMCKYQNEKKKIQTEEDDQSN
jgi:hypothetical protein